MMSNKNKKNRPLLSIVIPCYNIEGKANDLLKTISLLDDDVEVIFVDDGSTDSTWSILREFTKTNNLFSVKLLNQVNRGAGGARNSAIENSTGDYIWTIDADDDFDPIAIYELREKVTHGIEFDFIDFNMVSDLRGNTMGLKAGAYTVDHQNEIWIAKRFGSVTTKIFSKAFVERAHFSYPECVNSEDSCLAFFLPHFVNSFIKSETDVYIYHKGRTSRVLRRFYEREKVLACLWARSNCLAKGVSLYRGTIANEANLSVYSSRIRDTLLRNPLQTLISVRRPISILDAAKCFRFYRDVMKDLGFTYEPPRLDSLNSKQRLLAKLAHVVSLLLPCQHDFFRGIYLDLQPEFDGLNRRTMWQHSDWNK